MGVRGATPWYSGDLAFQNDSSIGWTVHSKKKPQVLNRFGPIPIENHSTLIIYVALVFF